MDDLEGYEIIEQILKDGEYSVLAPVYDPNFYLRDIVKSISNCREE